MPDRMSQCTPDRTPKYLQSRMLAVLPDRTQSICQIECLVFYAKECQDTFDGRAIVGTRQD